MSNATAKADEPLIHVVDDDESLRNALLRLLDASGLTVRGYASAGDFLLQPQEDRPGCLVLDLNMPGGPSGLELQAALQRLGIELPVIFLTGYGDLPSSVRALKAGAVDFLAKPVTRDTLLDAVRRALALDAEQRSRRQEQAALHALFDALTPREREIFDQLVAGQLNKQIAYTLDICERTVKSERAQIMRKLDATSIADLGRLTERLQLLSAGSEQAKS